MPSIPNLTPKPIETSFKGYRFRSRLEARWAVFFDALGIDWQYESEGWDLGSVGTPGDEFHYGWYLPDFVLENSIFVEIKPWVQPKDWVATGVADAGIILDRLAVSSGKRALLIQGSPWPGEYYVERYPQPPDPEDYQQFVFADCRRCDGIGLASTDEWSSLICTCTQERWKGLVIGGPRVSRALQLARSARFDGND